MFNWIKRAIEFNRLLDKFPKLLKPRIIYTQVVIATNFLYDDNILEYIAKRVVGFPVNATNGDVIGIIRSAKVENGKVIADIAVIKERHSEANVFIVSNMAEYPIKSLA